MTGQDLLQPFVDWFPLVPRARPPAGSLTARLAEIDQLARASQPAGTTGLPAAEALNKAALVASDCSSASFAAELCWRQLQVFIKAAPLPPALLKPALQPLVNLGRLATRAGDTDRAYAIFTGLHDAARTRGTVSIDQTDIDFAQLAFGEDALRSAERFLWAVVLADGTRALTRAGRWTEALDHVRRRNGIGQRLLDGRQVLVLAHCSAGDHREALDHLDASLAQEPWEKAVAAALRVLCLQIGNLPSEAASAAAADAYLTLDADAARVVFRSRLGLSLLALIPFNHAVSAVTSRLLTDARRNSDATAATQVLNDPHLRPRLTICELDTLTRIAGEGGLTRGVLPPEFLAELKTSTDMAKRNLGYAVARHVVGRDQANAVVPDISP
jgi:tetratricopeptide (TPR) repeat protein